jgi:SAM-dependent methyltransferase
VEKASWEERYGKDEYFFGKEPNDFFKEEIEKLDKGRILLIGDGEGRNSVYAAKLGWEADSIDTSNAGKQKAIRLAEENNVNINYTVADALQFNYPEDHYDAIALIYFHIENNFREEFNRKLLNSLKSNGSIIILIFAKEHLANKNGGPSHEELLYDLSDIAEGFIDLKFKLFIKEHRNRVKNGVPQKSTVIKFVGRKTKS